LNFALVILFVVIAPVLFLVLSPGTPRVLILILVLVLLQ
jgi:hypothetical protein